MQKFSRSSHEQSAEDTPQWALPFRRLYEYIALYAGLMMLGIGSLLWGATALLLRGLMPGFRGVWLGRRMASLGFRIYLFILHMSGAVRFDLRALDTLRKEGALIIAANHPGLLDAPMVLSRLPNVVCILKASLSDNPLWGATARLAGYISNDWFVGSVNLAVEELQRGCQLLLFPEGTRTETWPLGEFRSGLAFISHRSGVPIQTVIIEQDSEFLGKRHSLLKRPDLPMHFRIRLGQRFDPPANPREFTKTLQEYFLMELHKPSAATCQ